MSQPANLQPVCPAAVLGLTAQFCGCDGPNCQTFAEEDSSFTQVHAYALHSAQAYCMRNMPSESNVIADEAPESRVQYVVSEEPASNVQWVALRGTDDTKNLVVEPTLDPGVNHYMRRYVQLTRHFAKLELPAGQSLPDYPELMDCSR